MFQTAVCPLDKRGNGFLFAVDDLRISSSRTIKLAAQVSSSMRKARQPENMPSTIPAAWEVDPLASSVVKWQVSFPFGRSLINREISVSSMQRPILRPQLDCCGISDYILPPVPCNVAVNAISRAFKRVDLPW